MLRIYDTKQKINKNVYKYILNSQNESIKKHIEKNKIVDINLTSQMTTFSTEKIQLQNFKYFKEDVYLDFVLCASLFFLSTISSYLYKFFTKLK